MIASDEAAPRSLTERRLQATLAVARAHGTQPPLEELAELLPLDGPESPDELKHWLEAHPSVGLLFGEVDPSKTPGRDGTEERKERGARFSREAEWVATVVLRPVHRLVRSFGVSGSTAYGLPDQDDDLDFFAIVRHGGVWPFLLYAYLCGRFARPHRADGPREWCFNFVLDEAEARRTYRIPRGFLVAREALMMRPLLGGEYYRSLLNTAPWVREEIPRLYARVGTPVPGELPDGPPAPLVARGLNVLLYPLMASYLEMVALVQNRRFLRRGERARCFRVVPRPNGLTVESSRFASLDAMCRPADARQRATEAP